MPKICNVSAAETLDIFLACSLVQYPAHHQCLSNDQQWYQLAGYSWPIKAFRLCRLWQDN